MQQADVPPCPHTDAVALSGHLVTFGTLESVQIVRACPDCSLAWAASGQSGLLGPDDAAAFAEFHNGRQMLRDRIAAGGSLSALYDTIPTPAWYPRLGLAPSIESHLLLAPALLTDEAGLRATVRAQFDRHDLTSVATIATPAGDVAVGEIYENHFFEIDPNTGKDRRDPDHIFFIPLVRETLAHPIEVWEAQPGGKRTRRLSFFKLYLLNDEYAYHLAVVTKDGNLLTAHRIKGFTACQNRRIGIPRYVAY